MAFDLESSSPPDTGKGKELKTGNLKRSYNMKKCKPGQVYDQKLKECRAQKESADRDLKRNVKLNKRGLYAVQKDASLLAGGPVTKKEAQSLKKTLIKQKTSKTKKKVRGY